MSQATDTKVKPIKLYRDKSHGKWVWFISCPYCRFSFERPLKKAALRFAKEHVTVHDPEPTIVVKSAR